MRDGSMNDCIICFVEQGFLATVVSVLAVFYLYNIET
jgi:hypothetical protein